MWLNKVMEESVSVWGWRLQDLTSSYCCSQGGSCVWTQFYMSMDDWLKTSCDSLISYWILCMWHQDIDWLTRWELSTWVYDQCMQTTCTQGGGWLIDESAWSCPFEVGKCTAASPTLHSHEHRLSTCYM